MHTLLQSLHTSDIHVHVPCWFTVKRNEKLEICCVPHAPSLVPRSQACHKHSELGSNPVINRVARQ